MLKAKLQSDLSAISNALKNPIWKALNGQQSCFAVVGKHARYFIPEVTALAGIEDFSDSSFASLHRLVPEGGKVAVLFEDKNDLKGNWSVPLEFSIVQMAYMPDGAPEDSQFEFVTLGAKDVPAMMDLAQRTKPGPFGPRTYELGHYIGIYEDHKLLAMAGERLRPEGFTEISAVCTDPSARGRGYATLLINKLLNEIIDSGKRPFLHVAGENTKAIDLYKKIGFEISNEFWLKVLEPKS